MMLRQATGPIAMLLLLLGACGGGWVQLPETRESGVQNSEEVVSSPALQTFLDENGYEPWMVGVGSPPEGAAYPVVSASNTQAECHCGDIDSDGKISISDVAMLVRYLFAGDTSVSVACADVDGVPSVTNGDLDFLLAYMFQGGPAPCSNVTTVDPSPTVTPTPSATSTPSPTPTPTVTPTVTPNPGGPNPGAGVGPNPVGGGATCEAVSPKRCYYVAPNGSDGADGTITRPYKTFRPAVTQAQPGEFIYVRGGTYGYGNGMLSAYDIDAFISIQDVNGTGGYTVRSGTLNNPITIKNYTGETPILNLNSFPANRLNTGNRAAIEIREKSFWTIDGLEIVGGIVDFNSDSGGPTTNGNLTHDIIIRNNNIHDVTIANGDNPGLVRVNLGDNSGAYNVFVWANSLHDMYDIDQPGEWMGVGNQQHYGALTTLSCNSYPSKPCTGGGTGYIEFKNNHVYHIPQAFYFKNPSPGGVLVQGNVIHDVGGLGTLHVSGFHMKGNLVYGTDDGFWWVGRDGLLTEVYAFSAQNFLIENNTFVGLNRFMGFNQGSGIIRQNVFFGMANRNAGYEWAYIYKRGYVYPDPSNPADSVLQNIESNGNCFIAPYTNFQMVTREVGGMTEFYTPSQASTTFGFDTNSTITVEDVATDAFVSPSSLNYHLKPGYCPTGVGY